MSTRLFVESHYDTVLQAAALLKTLDR